MKKVIQISEKMIVTVFLILIVLSFLNGNIYAEEAEQSPYIKACVISDNSLVDGYGKSITYYVETINDEGLCEAPFSYDEGQNFRSDRSFVVRENGIKTILVKDRDENITSYRFEVNGIDNEAPYIDKLEYELDEVCNDYGRFVKVNFILKDDGVGLSDDPISYDGEVFFTKLSRTYYQNGEYSVRLRDRLGNEDNRSFVIDCIDSKAPEIISKGCNMSLSANGFSHDATLFVNASDDMSGLAAEAYSFDGGISFSSVNEKIVRENGIYRICVKDGLGNECYESIEVKGIDCTAPALDSAVLTLSDSHNNYGSKGVLRLEASDRESGLSDTAYSFDGGLTFSENNTYEVNDNGQIKVCIMDNVGNINADIFNVTQIDKGSPTIIVTGNPLQKVSSDVTLKVNATDLCSGIASIWFENTSGGKKTQIVACDGNVSKSDSVLITSNGTYKFYAYDCAGNEAIETVKVTKIDRGTDSTNSIKMGQIIGPLSSAGSSQTQSVGAKFLGNDNEGTSTEMIIKKDITPAEDRIDMDEFEEEAIEYENADFEIADSAITNFYPVQEKEMASSITQEDDFALSDADKPSISIEYPEKAEEINNNSKVIVTAIGIVFVLLGLLIFILYKVGMLERINVFRMLEEDRKDE